ncbi:hypothetical protein GLOTRDRAFT_96192 [Gloeophyllum trabeum ATCC 11539]|uniref:SWIM-type domain-containing protein n=1 Tax=Gloeophyllum trabeum (strain ATCC 11539 / FP-39264 / Madison 617) TaxID=670483 RepID=S7RAZ2_GLOTA|nr:uncharacterized protein GLOTRDRAFT_96192 [Gloeophyllum trabeum ATCC 11539]EPQ51420.1 hypothetical protein GLOTRDRAFT_96192 [Gloeophyllum trabeum ATCC 11539]
MLETQSYRDMPQYNPLTANHCYHFLPKDAVRLYHLFNKQQGVNTHIPLERNLDEWMDPTSPNFRNDIQESVFYYSKHADAGEQLKVCICTEDMEKSAWQYVHQSTILLDGTFGICTSRLLLFVVMGVDARRKGIPLALFLFSAPTGSRATHAGYSTSILAELLQHWRDSLSGRKGVAFCPYVAITNTDIKGHRALLLVWPEIWLLLCKFHLRLLNSVEHGAACALIEEERSNCRALEKLGGAGAAPAAQAGLKYLDYLKTMWMPEPLWLGWSRQARIRASAILSVPVDDILTTTNHLESFNHVLKNKCLPQWQHSGARLRFDFLIHILITEFIPEFFASRREREWLQRWIDMRFQQFTGGEHLCSSLDDQRQAKAAKACCWWEADTLHDQAARVILHAGLLTSITRGSSGHQFEALCSSTAANFDDPTHVRYRLTICQNGGARCSCPDFLHRGGACKHLRAMQMIIDGWVAAGNVPHFNYPSSLPEARQINTIPVIPPIEPRPQAAAIISSMLMLQDMAADLGGAQVDAAMGSGAAGRAMGLLGAGPSLVAIQVQQRAEQIIQSVLPQLRGLALIMQESKLSESSQITEIREVVSRLHLSLSGQIEAGSSLPAPPEPSATHYSKCHRGLGLLSPSPELKQKRHKSYATL